MSFKSYAAIILGMVMLGFSLGIVVGVYLQFYTGTHRWAYISVPIMGIGSGFAAYGTLLAVRASKGIEEQGDG